MNKKNTERTDEHSSKKRISIKCIVCGKDFFSTAKEVERGKKYCSNECRHKKGNRVISEKVKISCHICGKEMIITKRQFENGKKYCSVECQHIGAKAIKAERVGVKCLFCNKIFKTTKWRYENTNKKYCSKDCCNKHKKETYVGEKNPMFGTKQSEERKKKTSEVMKNIWKNKAYRKNFREKFNEYFKRNGFSYGHSENSNYKRKETLIKLFGVDHIWKSKDIRKKIENTILKKYGITSLELAQKGLFKKRETSIEKKMREILERNRICFKQFYFLRISNGKFKIYDFFICDYNLLIEADGDYWHGNPKSFKTLNECQNKNKENDKYKNKLAINYNFNIERFWESEINNDNFENILLKTLKKYEKNTN